MTNDLYDDMRRLNALYEELCWNDDDELVFTHDGERVIIYNKTQNETVSYTHLTLPTILLV